MQALARAGLDLRIVMPRDWRIQLADLERVVDRNTKLIELSHVAMFTGFQHDLKAVCDLAHANGALVYADIAQSRGRRRSTSRRAASISAPARASSG